jgi:uncharacterized repeat protein (TIGR03803 family)
MEISDWMRGKVTESNTKRTNHFVLSLGLLVLMISRGAQCASPTFTTLYNFAGATDGGDPQGVTLGRNGVLYGTTWNGGTTNWGTVFSLTPPSSPGGSWTHAVLYSFQGTPNDGRNPQAGVVVGAGGILYGTTAFGGHNDAGTIFSLSPPASPAGAWSEALLYTFTGGCTGSLPTALVIGNGGVLYGSTYGGGCPSNGIVFSLTPPANPGDAWTGTTLYSFQGGTDGAVPNSGLAIGSGGVLYGSTATGGFNGKGGTVFSLTPPMYSGGAWTEAVLVSFEHNTVYPGGFPTAGVAIGNGGVLYGTASHVAYSLAAPGVPGGLWTETQLATIRPPYLMYGVVIGKTGIVYSTAADAPPNDGIVFALKPPSSAGGKWTKVTLHTFTGSDGIDPCCGSMIIGRGETLYGVTLAGGAYGFGTIYSLQP